MSTHQDSATPGRISLRDAARRLATPETAAADIEIMLAHAIEHGELHADVRRWATEQWEGTRLPGNIDRLQTFLTPADLSAWMALKGIPAALPVA